MIDLKSFRYVFEETCNLKETMRFRIDKELEEVRAKGDADFVPDEFFLGIANAEIHINKAIMALGCALVNYTEKL